jgi:phage terminase small subunit
MALTAKQEAFVREYLIDLNATQAAIRAGYSARTAQEQGSRLLSNAMVAEAVKAAQDARAERTEITADRVLTELAKIGFADIRRIFTQTGALLTPGDMEDDAAATISSIEVVEKPRRDADGNVEIEYVRKIRTWDKLGALTQMGRHLGMFTDKLELGASDELVSRMEAARRRASGG